MGNPTPLEGKVLQLLKDARVGKIDPHYSVQSETQGAYSPEIDFYITASDEQSSLIRKLRTDKNWYVTSIAMEVQGSGNRKHRMGDIINAAFGADAGIGQTNRRRF